MDQLTKAQQTKLKEYEGVWDKIGVLCEPADRPAAEDAVARAYDMNKSARPKKFLWMDSPLSGAIAAHFVSEMTPANWKREFAKLKKKTSFELIDWYRKQDEDVRRKVAQWRSNACYGQHYAGWLVYIDFMDKELGDAEAKKCKPLVDMAKAACWWWPFTEIAIITERPTQVHFDDQGRLHNATGPAIAFPDEASLWVIHGINVSKQVVESPETMTPAQIDGESNAEVRRVMIERFGQARYLLEGNAKVLHKDEWGTLYRKDRPGDTPIVMVKVVNSTPEVDGTFKDYFIRVHPELRPMTKGKEDRWELGEPQEMTARNAIASIQGLTGSKYKPLVET